MTRVPWYKTIRWKLFLGYLAFIMGGVVVFGLGVRLIAGAYIGAHVGEMDRIFPGPFPDGPRGGRTLMMVTLAELMVRAVENALFWSMLSAVIIAVVLSFYFSRRISGPILEMAEATERIADGDFSRRTSKGADDELGVLSDSLNRMAERLERTEEQRRRLIGDLAHELRTPLTGVRGYMEGMIDGVIPVEPENLRDVQRQAERLTRLVEDMQRLSRLQEGQEELRLAEVDLGALIGRTVERMRLHSSEARIEVRLHAPEPILVIADADRVEQVLINLISNALVHSLEGGAVTIDAAVRGTDGGEEAVVSVTDEGPGIPEELRESIFERFYRADPSRARGLEQSGGSGLGLTIARHIVEAHGGRIWVESPASLRSPGGPSSTGAPGSGAAFRFTLPRPAAASPSS